MKWEEINWPHFPATFTNLFNELWTNTDFNNDQIGFNELVFEVLIITQSN